MKSDADLIGDECDALKAMLIEKSKAYGSSWRDPVRVFSRADPVEQLRVRIDDKLSRLTRGHAADEDTVLDLLGYLVLLRIATRKLDLKMPEGWNDPQQEPRDTDGRECGARLDAVADVMGFQRGYVDGRSETDEEFRERIKTGLTDDMAAPEECRSAGGIPEEFLKAAREAPSIVDVLSDPNGPASKSLFTNTMWEEWQMLERAAGHVPSDGAGFDGPMTQVIETALALETVVRDLDAGGRASLGVRDILAYHAAKLRTYAASLLPKPRPEGREHLPIEYELDRAESIAARLRKENTQIKATCDQLRRELEENSDAVTKLQIEAEVVHKANDALVDEKLRLTRERDETRAARDTLAERAVKAEREYEQLRQERDANMTAVTELQAKLDQQAEIAGKLGARVTDLQEELTVARDALDDQLYDGKPVKAWWDKAALYGTIAAHYNAALTKLASLGGGRSDGNAIAQEALDWRHSSEVRGVPKADVDAFARLLGAVIPAEKRGG